MTKDWYLETVVEDDPISSRFVEFVDFEGVLDLGVSYSDTRPLREIWRRYVEKGCLGTVIFAPRDLPFGIARMVQAVLEASGFAPEGTFRVERDAAAAEQAIEALEERDQDR